jgi:hypothetical protein
VERPVVARLAGEDRGPEVRRRPAGERRPADADRVEGVGVAVADGGEVVLGGEADDALVERSTEGGRVEGLERDVISVSRLPSWASAR